jgi:hypothetical protein
MNFIKIFVDDYLERYNFQEFNKDFFARELLIQLFWL